MVKSAANNPNAGQLFSPLHFENSLHRNCNTRHDGSVAQTMVMMIVNINRFHLHLTSATWTHSCTECFALHHDNPLRQHGQHCTHWDTLHTQNMWKSLLYFQLSPNVCGECAVLWHSEWKKISSTYAIRFVHSFRFATICPQMFELLFRISIDISNYFHLFFECFSVSSFRLQLGEHIVCTFIQILHFCMFVTQFLV